MVLICSSADNGCRIIQLFVKVFCSDRCEICPSKFLSRHKNLQGASSTSLGLSLAMTIAQARKLKTPT